jgi:hypothetical protein
MVCAPVPEISTAISPSQFAAGCTASLAGIQYFLATLDGRTIAFVSTQDALFRTPEGISIGSSLADVQAAGGSPVVEILGWAYVAHLPSGWTVHFPGVPGVTGVAPTPDSLVWKLSRATR